MVDTPFVEELSGMAMVKILGMKEQNHKHDKIEVYLEQSGFEDQKQNM